DCTGMTTIIRFDRRHLDVIDAADPSGLMNVPAVMLVVMCPYDPAIKAHGCRAMGDHWIIRENLPFCNIGFDRLTDLGEKNLRYGTADGLQSVDPHSAVSRRPKGKQFGGEPSIEIVRYGKLRRREPTWSVDQGPKFVLAPRRRGSGGHDGR